MSFGQLPPELQTEVIKHLSNEPFEKRIDHKQFINYMLTCKLFFHELAPFIYRRLDDNGFDTPVTKVLDKITNIERFDSVYSEFVHEISFSIVNNESTEKAIMLTKCDNWKRLRVINMRDGKCPFVMSFVVNQVEKRGLAELSIHHLSAIGPILSQLENSKSTVKKIKKLTLHGPRMNIIENSYKNINKSSLGIEQLLINYPRVHFEFTDSSLEFFAKHEMLTHLKLYGPWGLKNWNKNFATVFKKLKSLRYDARCSPVTIENATTTASPGLLCQYLGQAENLEELSLIFDPPDEIWIPKANHNLKSLKIIELSFLSFEGNEFFRNKYLSHFIKSCPSLEKLTLKINGYADYSFNDIVITDTHPTLKYVQIMMIPIPISITDFELQFIQLGQNFPSLESIEIPIYLDFKKVLNLCEKSAAAMNMNYKLFPSLKRAKVYLSKTDDEMLVEKLKGYLPACLFC